jgi:hypothetical protein
LKIIEDVLSKILVVVNEKNCRLSSISKSNYQTFNTFKKDVFLQYALCFKKPVEGLNSCQMFDINGVLLHPIVQAIYFKKPAESLKSCQTIVCQNKFIFPYYCTRNMVQKACGKFKFLSNNCSAKKVYFSNMQYASKSLWKV